MLTLYGIPNCDTVKKARAWLAGHGIDYRFHDFKRDGLPEPLLRAWVAELGWEALINRQGTTWRKVPPEQRDGLDEDGAVRLMLASPSDHPPPGAGHRRAPVTWGSARSGTRRSSADDRSPTLALARELIRRPSVTPDDAGCQALIGLRLAALGFHLEPMPSNGVTNLWARRGTAGPLFCFAGHTDVVPPGPAGGLGVDPFEPQVRDGLLYGRGAADMKGSIAAMVTATEAFVRAHPDHRGSIAFLITSDEEGVATDGTVKVVEALQARGEGIDWCLVGEPSCRERLGDTIKNGRRGSLNGFLTVHRPAGPRRLPPPGQEPPPRLRPGAGTPGGRGVGPGQCPLPAHQLPDRQPQRRDRGGERDPRAPDGPVQPALLQRADGGGDPPRVTAILDAGGFDYDLTWRLSGHPFLTPAGELVEAARAAIAEVTGSTAELSTSGGTSDGRFIAPLGAQVVELGPLNATIHQANECVAVADLERLSAIYQGILERLLPD